MAWSKEGLFTADWNSQFTLHCGSSVWSVDPLGGWGWGGGRPAVLEGTHGGLLLPVSVVSTFSLLEVQCCLSQSVGVPLCGGWILQPVTVLVLHVAMLISDLLKPLCVRLWHATPYCDVSVACLLSRNFLSLCDAIVCNDRLGVLCNLGLAVCVSFKWCK